MAFDLAGAARDLDERARRYGPIYAQGGEALSACVRLLHRNPAIAPTIREAIEAELVKIGGGVGLEQPLFTEDGELHRKIAR